MKYNLGKYDNKNSLEYKMVSLEDDISDYYPTLCKPIYHGHIIKGRKAVSKIITELTKFIYRLNVLDIELANLKPKSIKTKK